MASKKSSLIGQTVWVLTGHSESGDDFGPLVFAKKPTEREQKEIAFSWDGDEGRDGLGDYGSYVSLTLSEVEVE